MNEEPLHFGIPFPARPAIIPRVNLTFSKLGSGLAGGSGIGELMDDLGHALANGGPDLRMLGGGQPAQIPAVNAIWRERLAEIIADPAAANRFLSTYDPPQGNPAFIAAIADLMRETFGWDILPENVGLTCGGQTAFFHLFNLLAGEMPDGTRRKILFPLVPEYIGYAAQGLDPGMFLAMRPEIETTGPHEFKYHIDFDHLPIGPDIAAICVSRPTNPTGNVLSDAEMARLSAIARENGIPLIIDNAYGAPFPGIIFEEATPFWRPHAILTYSLSKIGLPGTRTGIVIGPPEIIRAVGSMSAIVGLSNTNIGQLIMLPLIESGEVLRLSREVVRPFYQEKRDLALKAAAEAFGDDIEWAVHRSEGALFLWFWFAGLRICSKELYERLKQRGVLIIPGGYFFYGLDDAGWKHRDECIRVSYAMDEAAVRDGLRIIAEEVRKAMNPDRKMATAG